MPETFVGNYAFTVKDEYQDSAGRTVPPAIMLDARNNDLQILDGGFLMMQLRKGVTDDQARDLARFLDKYVESVSYTSR